MIKFVSEDFKDIKIGSKQVVKVTQGIDVVWEKKSDTLVYSDTGRSSYDISVNGWSKVNPNKNYKFVTSKPDNEYSIMVSGSYNTVKNNSVFRITKNCDIKIKNTDYNYYDIKIYEVDEKASIII
ncbi:hypothetical protein ACF3OI_01150 [Finegoldia magna]|uniref:hypothetical protein n=1 Tax=Finegoldia magna TaxID=1260 RepID=UPI00370D8A59